MKTKLTIREEEVLEYIIKFKEVNGYAPTVREICQGINTKSRTHVHEMMCKLRDLGYITFKNNQPRTIVVTRFI